MNCDIFSLRVLKRINKLIRDLKARVHVLQQLVWFSSLVTLRDCVSSILASFANTL